MFLIFSELYSVYYHTVAKILAKALEGEISEQEIKKEIRKSAFSESTMAIFPALQTGKWQLLDDDFLPVIENPPTMPLTTLQKRWLRSLSDDPRIRLFDADLSAFSDAEPLFTREDYKIYDQYLDGDPFEDEAYIQNFRLILQAVKEKRPVKITMMNRSGNEMQVRFFPQGFEYSLKDDKIRILADGCRFRYYNLAKIIKAEWYTGDGPWNEHPEKEERKDLVLRITNERNALERAMLHFAHFEKSTERMDEKQYLLKLKYYKNDETELVIRILSFGPCIQVLEPEHFVDLIKERLWKQKNCGLL